MRKGVLKDVRKGVLKGVWKGVLIEYVDRMCHLNVFLHKTSTAHVLYSDLGSDFDCRMLSTRDGIVGLY